MSTDENKNDSGDDTIWLILAAIVLLSIFALPAALLMLIFSKVSKTQRNIVIGLAALGIAIFLVFGVRFFKAEFIQFQMDLKSRAWGDVFGHIPRFWLYTLVLAPGVGLIWDSVRPRTKQEKLDEKEKQRLEKQTRQELKKWKEAKNIIAKMKDNGDAPLGVIVDMRGDLGDFERKAQLLFLKLASSVANLHGLVLGGSGAGKTETIKRLIYIFASQTDYAIFLIDPKPLTRKRELDEVPEANLKLVFAGLMAQFGRKCRMYPDEPFNGFRGDARALHNRLLTIPVLGSEGASAYYAEMTEEYLWLAINAGDGLPLSFADVMQRLDYDYLLSYYHDDAASLQSIDRITRKDANSITMRFSNIARKFANIHAEGWAFEDVQSGYFALPVLESNRDVQAIARFLIEDLKHYFSARKKARRTVVIFDEFSAFGSENVVNLMELVRSLGGIVFIASQTTAALGDDRLQKRILGNVTTYLQRMNDPRDIAELGGMQQVMDISQRLGDTAKLSDGTMRYTDKAIIDPTKVAQLPAGGAYIINRGRVAQVQIMQAPDVDWGIVAQNDMDIALKWYNYCNPLAPIHVHKQTPEPPPPPDSTEPSQFDDDFI